LLQSMSKLSKLSSSRVLTAPKPHICHIREFWNEKETETLLTIFVADVLLLHNWKLKLAIIFAEYRCLEGVNSIPCGWLSRTAGSYVGAVQCIDAHTNGNNTFIRTPLTLCCCVL
jgi:hypothetical protein